MITDGEIKLPASISPGCDLSENYVQTYSLQAVKTDIPTLTSPIQQRRNMLEKTSKLNKYKR